MTIKEQLAGSGPIEALPNEDALQTAKRVNIKDMVIRSYRGMPYYKFTAVNDKRGYAYDLNKGMHPTLSAMMDAFQSDRALQKEEVCLIS